MDAQETPDTNTTQNTQDNPQIVEEETTTLFITTEKEEKDDGKQTGSTSVIHVAEVEARTLLIKTEHEEEVGREEVVKIMRIAETDAREFMAEAETHEPIKEAVQDAKTFGNFWLKFLNDWVFNFASGLAYHLLTAMFPIVIALLITIGFISGGLSPHAQTDLINHLNAFFPSVLSSQDVLAPALVLIRKDAGFLGFLAIFVALISGSRLFITLEDFFDVIYHTQARSFLRQNLMAIGMLLLFIVLIPVMLLASSISQGISGFFTGVIASWLLFEAIYMFVPNQHISLRNSWPGAVVAALALQLYIALFPLYARHFLGSYTGNAGFAVILLIFFYYFAIILLLGAEVNAYYAEDIRGTPTNIAGLVHRATLDVDKAKLAELAQRKAARKALKR